MQSSNTDPVQRTRNPASRDKALDFVKGWLVVGMVIYHAACLNERAGDAGYSSVQSIFNFVSGSWIYLSGVIIATYYANKSITNWGRVARRLITRGIKLLVILVGINVLLIILGWSKHGLELSWSTLYTALIPGTGAVSFEILIGISYVLLISPFLLIQKRLGNIIALLILLSALLLHHYNVRLEYNHWAIACGMGGFLVGGFLGSNWFRGLLHSWRNNILLIITSMLVVVSYFSFKYIWGYDKHDILVYLIGISSILATLYLLFPWAVKFKSLVYLLDILGRYPLVSYIWQMGVIVSLEAMKNYLGIELPYMVDLLIVIVVLILSIQMLNAMVSRYVLVNKIYRLLFG